MDEQKLSPVLQGTNGSQAASDATKIRIIVTRCQRTQNGLMLMLMV